MHTWGYQEAYNKPTQSLTKDHLKLTLNLSKGHPQHSWRLHEQYKEPT
jgi:hypothetical protein